MILANATALAETSDIYINYILISVVSFALGTIVGWSISQTLSDLEQSNVRKLMAVVMLGAYVVSLVADIGMSGYSTPFLLHTIMGGIFGYLFSKGDGINFTLRGE
jgi:uncharacterized membrane protein YqgA involved in biofilm formation